MNIQVTKLQRKERPRTRVLRTAVAAGTEQTDMSRAKPAREGEQHFDQLDSEPPGLEGEQRAADTVMADPIEGLRRGVISACGSSCCRLSVQSASAESLPPLQDSAIPPTSQIISGDGDTRNRRSETSGDSLPAG